MLEKLTALIQNLDLAELTSTYAIPWAINIVMALVIYIVGKMVVGIIVNLLRKLLIKAKWTTSLLTLSAPLLAAF
jgi:Conserved TM helix.